MSDPEPTRVDILSFQSDCLRLYEDWRALEPDAAPHTRYLRAVRKDALGYARRVLARRALDSGLLDLTREGHADLTLEALVLQRRSLRLFTEAERTAARDRLDRAADECQRPRLGPQSGEVNA